jgi:alkylation response protein AidB-like acyl-CoA dehydrogenase
MRFLAVERHTLESLLPGLDGSLSQIPLLELERPDNVGIRAFRESTGPGLLIPTEYAGCGATALDAVRVQRALATRSPSLAVATTMHHFSVVTLVDVFLQRKGPEVLLLDAIAKQRLLVASGFAEGRSGSGILTATMRAKRTAGGLVVCGVKRPCSLSRSMNLLTASVMVDGEPDKADEFAVLLIPAQSPGIERRPFWESSVLTGAESDEVVLTDVTVPNDLAWFAGSSADLDPVQTSGFLWFELLIAATYLGTASALAERVFDRERGNRTDRMQLAIELESAMAAIEGIARWMSTGAKDQDVLARMLLVRYAVEGAIGRASNLAVELLGGIAFIRSAEIAYLLAACRALAFHPPSRTSMSQAMMDYLAGEPLAIP